MRSLLQLPSGSVRELLCLVAVAAQRGIGRHERKSRVPMMTVPIDNNLVLVAALMLRPYFASSMLAGAQRGLLSTLVCDPVIQYVGSWSLCLILFPFFRLPEADAFSAAVALDEFDAGGRQGLLNHNQRGRPRVHFPGLKVTDGYDTDVSRISELLLAPIKQPPSSSALRR
jgi:hypothetical protein